MFANRRVLTGAGPRRGHGRSCIAHASQGRLFLNKGACVQGRDVCATLRKINSQARETNEAPPEMILEAPLVALSGKSFEGCQTSFDVSDTPGPNEAGTDAVRPQVSDGLHLPPTPPHCPPTPLRRDALEWRRAGNSP